MGSTFFKRRDFNSVRELPIGDRGGRDERRENTQVERHDGGLHLEIVFANSALDC